MSTQVWDVHIGPDGNGKTATYRTVTTSEQRARDLAATAYGCPPRSITGATLVYDTQWDAP